MVASLKHFSELVAGPPIFVFPWAGNSSAGFGATYSSMIKALLTCVTKGVGFRFSRIDKPTGIAIREGYADFFEPFCGQVGGLLLKQLNIHPFPFQARLPALANCAEFILRASTSPRSDYFLFSDLSRLPDIRRPTDLGLASDDYVAFRTHISRLLWQLRPPARQVVDSQIRQVRLPAAPYLSVVLRRGDKIMESAYARPESYLPLIYQHLPESRNIFVASDSLSAIDALSRLVPEANCYHVPPPSGQGYVHAQFLRMPAPQRFDFLNTFFAQVELLAGGQSFIATHTTNVSYLACYLRPGGRTFWVD